MSDTARPLRIAFLVLAHEHPALCARLVRRLLDEDDSVVMHLDAKAPEDFRRCFDDALGESAGQVRWARRETVVWGEWSMVRATLNGLQCLRDSGVEPDYVYLLSGADYPIRPLGQLRDFLGRNRGVDFIEHQDARVNRWVRQGPQEERYLYHHRINWRRHPRWFNLALNLQRWLGLKRRFPEHLQPHMGSQWWVLTWRTCREVMALAERPEIERFFRTTWVPDELFFQTAVASLAAPGTADGRHLTHYLFTDYGVPLVFHDGHEDYLDRQPFFFARKLSPRADALRQHLDHRLSSPAPAPRDDDVGRDTGDYGQFIHRHRHGPWGQRCWGQPGSPGLGELDRIHRPWFLVVARNPEWLDQACTALNALPDVRCHGRLFDGDMIDFAPGIDRRSVYAHDDMPIRDQDRACFLAELMRQEDSCGWGFTWLIDGSENDTAPPEEADLGPFLARLARHPDAHIVHLATEAQDQRLFEQISQARLRDGPPRVRARWTRLDPAGAGVGGVKDGGLGRQIAGALGFSSRQEGAPEPEVRRREPRTLFLHIGVHRTGTTAIQRLLHHNREALRRQGFHYAFDTENHTRLASPLQETDKASAEVVERLVQDAEEAGLPRVIVSGEDLSRIPYPDRLAPLMDHFEVRVICYLRRQDRWMESWYNQHVRWPWEPETSRMSPSRFLALHPEFHWLDYQALLIRWADVFGEDNLVVRVFEEARETPPFTQDFLGLCGIDPTLLEEAEAHQNASLAPQATEIIRHLEQFERQPRDRVLVIRAIAEACQEAGLAQTRHVLSGQQRFDLLREHVAGNHWVAREFLGRENGSLFPGELPPEDPTPPDLAPPQPSALLEGVGHGVLRYFLPLIVAATPDWTVEPQLRQALFEAEFLRKRLRGRLNTLNWRLKSRRALARDLAGGGATSEPHTQPSGSPDRSATEPLPAPELATRLGAMSFHADERAVLDRVISNWKTVCEGEETDPGWLDLDPERYLSGAFRHLVDILCAELATQQLLSEAGPDAAKGLLPGLQRRVGTLQKKIERKTAILASPVRKAGRLLRPR